MRGVKDDRFGFRVDGLARFALDKLLVLVQKGGGGTYEDNHSALVITLPERLERIFHPVTPLQRALIRAGTQARGATQDSTHRPDPAAGESTRGRGHDG